MQRTPTGREIVRVCVHARLRARACGRWGKCARACGTACEGERWRVLWGEKVSWIRDVERAQPRKMFLTQELERFSR
eukprot:5758573-Pleurochrysis_carterae.AAC.1